MATSSETLEALLSVQDLDTALDQWHHRRASLPERGQLAAIDGQLAELEIRLAAAQAGRDEAAGRQQALEDGLNATEARAGEVHRRLYGGTVSATRELQAMAADLDALHARASDFESRALEVMEELEPLDADVAAIEAGKGSLLAARAELEDKLRVGEIAVDAEIDAHNAMRAMAAANVPDELMTTYAQLRRRLGGVGAARLVGSLCTGCHLTLAATELDELRRQPAGTVMFCEQCGRILVRAQPS